MIFRRASEYKVVSLLIFGARASSLLNSAPVRTQVAGATVSSTVTDASGVAMAGEEQFLHDLSQK
jgi:hypothetical protein